jgi:acetyltransferase
MVDLAVLCTPAPTIPEIVRECGNAGTRGIIIISAGFKEIGEEGKALENSILEVKERYEGMRILGPNCLGIIVPSRNMNVSFAHAMPKDGDVAVISQSGALCTSILDWAMEEDIGFSYFVSIGNMLDIDFGDLVDYFGEHPNTDSMVLYIESISDAREFMSASRAFTRTKPVVAYKSGRFIESAQAATSHTGAMTGEDVVYDAAFRRAGIVRVFDIDDVFDSAELLALVEPPAGERLAIVTNAGGPGVMTTDILISLEGRLAKLAPETTEKLNEFLPAFWSHQNPVDVLGDAPPERIARATKVVLSDPGVDAVLVILTPQAMTDPTGTAVEIGIIAHSAEKPILTAWMGGLKVREGITILNRAKIPTYNTPEQAVRAFMHLVSYKRNQEVLYETPRNVPIRFTFDRIKIRERLEYLFSQGETLLSEIDSKKLLEAYGIPVVTTRIASSADEATTIAGEIGYPVVLKIFSPDITHKTDVGGVVLNLKNRGEVLDAFETMTRTAREKMPHAQIEGVTVQRMVDLTNGFELILGTKKDITFGSTIMVGMGGITAELFHDRALELPPLNERLARRMLDSLKSAPLLHGYRGRPGADMDKLLEVLIRFSYLVADYPEISELDINPLLVTEKEVVALDARVIIDSSIVGQTLPPYSHLAICPYPEEYERPARLADKTPVILRPIKPEDIPLWRELLDTFSEETIRFRFLHPIREITHDMAARYCFIDYDREIGIVAETEERNKKTLLGVGRLIIDPDRKTAEFTVAVGDPHQGRGAGSLLVDHCVEIARHRRIKEISTRMLPDNEIIIKMFQRRGFSLSREGEFIRGELTLGKK